MTSLAGERRNFGKIVDEAPGPMSARDQAEGLRRLVPAARVVAVTSGKGGVGKTNVAVNVAIALAASGKRTVLVDLDLGLANADVLLDMNPRHTIADVAAGRRSAAEAAVSAGRYLRIVPGASGVASLANLGEEELRGIALSLESLARESDFLVLDTGAGISRATTAFLAAADEALVVTTPDPTAIVDAFAVLKLLSREARRGGVGLLVNQALTAAEAERTSHGIASTAARLLDLHVARRGWVPSDPALAESVRRRTPVLLDNPGSASGRALRALAESLAGPEGPRGGGFLDRIRGIHGR